MPAEGAGRGGRRLGRALTVAFLIALAASHAVRRLAPGDSPALDGRSALEIAAVDGDRRRPERAVTLAYRDLAPESARPGALPVVLLHGSPGGLQDFDGLAARLATGGRRVLRPDLPGFGASRQPVPDYSVRAHAAYVRDWLDSLGVSRAHVVGFSMGGGVAIELAADRPERAASVTLIGSIGVQELELLGDYRVNHAIHRLQLAGVWLLHEAVPHFGALDGFPLDVPFARNFTDTDQRPLRGLLRELTAPTLIVHGRHDSLVPYAAAVEHHRLVPQSELRTFEDQDHFLLWTRTEAVAAAMEEFLARVENGTAVAREAADPARVVAAAVPYADLDRPPAAGLQLVVLVALLVLGTLVTEDLTCIAAGLLIAHGRIDPLPGILACAGGIYFGDLLLYLAGRLAGPSLLRRRPWRWFLHEEAVRAAARWFERRGMIVVLMTRFVPGSRLPAYVAAGLVRASFPRFALWFLLAVAIWTPALVGTAALAGSGRPAAWPWLLALGAGLWAAVGIGVPALTAAGRRALRVRWRRLRAWEFWPLWIFYLPVLARIVLLMVRYRSVTLVSAVNPSMPEGGFVGESKSEILRALSAGAGDGEDVVAATLALPARADPDDAARRAEDWRRGRGLGWPLVVKPDVGQRGEGVRVVRDSGELRSALADARGATLVQEFVDGPEYGVFWARHPDEPRGHVFSVTEKVLPEVVGDGIARLDELILRDPRASLIAETYFAESSSRLDAVPAAGERVRLVEIGTHCRGAVFLDGARLITPELEAAFDRIGSAYEGFCFGRFDVRAPSEAGFRAGRFRVLELNGMTSEATHVYDPRHRLLTAWRTLFRQWELAFRIAAANRARGARPARLRTMLRRLWDYSRANRGMATPSPPAIGSCSPS